MNPTLRSRLAIAAGWTGWFLFHLLIAPIAHLLVIWPVRAFSWTVRNLILPPLRACAAWCREHSN